MKQKTATVWLIILNALAYFAGAWAVFGSMTDSKSIGEAIIKSILFLVVLPAPLIFVWRFFLFTYDFTKKKFCLCTLLPPIIFAAVVGAVMIFFGGLVGFAASFAYNAATVCLIIGTVIWTLAKGSCRNRVLAIILLTVCSAIIFWRLYGLLNIPFPMAIIYRKEPITAALVARYVFAKLVPAAVLAIPIGFGVSALMKIYREDYSLKPQLFMLCAFAPSLLVAGVRMLLKYLGDKELYFYQMEFSALFDTFILTAAVAIVSAIIYAVAALIRSKKHYY